MLGCMGYGLWVMGYGLWVEIVCVGDRLWVMGYGLWVTDCYGLLVVMGCYQLCTG